VSEYVCGTWIKFQDGGDPELMILHRGDEKSCVRMLGLIPGIAYNGSRPVDEAGTFLIPASEWDALPTEAA